MFDAQQQDTFRTSEFLLIVSRPGIHRQPAIRLNRKITMEQSFREVFSESLNINVTDVVDSLPYGESPQWDPIAHMSLVAATEERFDIMLDAEDVIDMSSFEKAKVSSLSL